MCSQPQLLCFHEYSGLVMSRSPCFSSDTNSLPSRPYSVRAPEPVRKDVCFEQFRVFPITVIHCKKKLLYRGLRTGLIYAHGDVNQRVFWCYFHLAEYCSRMLSLESYELPIHGSLADIYYWNIRTCRVGLKSIKSNQKALVTATVPTPLLYTLICLATCIIIEARRLHS